MDFKFVHAADLHLDSPLQNVEAEGELGELVHGATFEALRRIVTLCLEERVDFLVLAGDLYDAKDRSVRARLALREQLTRLADAGIPSFLVHGNHDPLLTSAGTVRMPPAVKVFGTSWEEVTVRRGDQVLCRVQGISYGQERITENLSAHYRRQGPEFTVGVLHANVGGSSQHAAYAPCSHRDLDDRELDYWALGHVHTRAEQRLPRGGWAIYPGNSQGRHVNEPGARGCYVVKVRGNVAEPRFVPLEPVRWEPLRVDIEGLGTVDELIEAVVAEVPDCPGHVRAQVLRVILEGRGALHRELQSPDTLGQLREHLAPALAARPRPVVLEGLVDRASPALDLGRIREAGGLAAEVLTLAEGSGEDVPAASLEALTALDKALQAAGLPPLQPQLEGWRGLAAGRALELLLEET